MTQPFTLGRASLNADGKPFSSRLLQHALMVSIADPCAVAIHPELASQLNPYLTGLTVLPIASMPLNALTFLDEQGAAVGAITNLQRCEAKEAA